MIYAYAGRAAAWVAAAAWMLAQLGLLHYFIRKMPGRMEEGVKLWAVRGIFWIVLTAIQAAQGAMPFFYNYMLRVFVQFLYVAVTRQTGVLQAGYVSLVFFLVKDICKMTLLDVAHPFLGLPAQENPWVNAGSMAVCAGMQFLILGQAEKAMRMEGQLRLKKTDLAAVFFPIIPYALIKWLQMSNYARGDEQELGVSVVCLMLCVCDLFLLIQTEYRIAAQRVREEMEALRLCARARQEWHRQEQEKIEQINKIYHDMRHHLNYINSLSDNGKIREYIGSIAGDMEMCQVFPATGNEVADSLLAQYDARCARLGIRLIPMVNGRAFGFMEPKDLLVILGNALDNALEAVVQVEQEARREIRLRMDARQGFAVIRVENHFSGQVAFDEGGAVRTAKRDGGGHGYGIKSIRSAAGKYGGEAAVDAAGGIFVLTVMIPMGVQAKAEGGGSKKIE